MAIPKLKKQDVIDAISVIKHGLKIPIDAQNYSEFTAKMKVQEQEFTSVFYA